MIEMKFYRDDEYVYINNPDGTTKRATIEDFEKVFSGGEKAEMTLNCIFFHPNSGQLRENGVALTYKDLTSKWNNNIVPVVRWTGAGRSKNAYLVSCYAPNATREVRFITVNDNGVVSVMLFTAPNNTTPLTLID